MSISTDCSVTVRGPKELLETVTAAILKDAEPIAEGPDAGEFRFTLKAESWRELEGSHAPLWIKSAERYRCERVLGPSGATHDELRIVGQSTDGPPVVFAQRVIDRFPGVDIDLHATTEHEDYEHWQSLWAGAGDERRHRMLCRREELTNLENDDVVRLVIDGKQVLPRRDAGTADVLSSFLDDGRVGPGIGGADEIVFLLNDKHRIAKTTKGEVLRDQFGLLEFLRDSIPEKTYQRVKEAAGKLDPDATILVVSLCDGRIAWLPRPIDPKSYAPEGKR